MATARSVINMALRRIGRLGSGETATTQEYLDCMEYLRGIYNQNISSGVLGRLEEVILDDNVEEYTARPNTHIFTRGCSIEDITLPDAVSSYGCSNDYGDHVRGDGGKMVPPSDGSVVAITDANSEITLYSIFDGSTKEWVVLNELNPEDENNRYDLEDVLDLYAPLSERDPTGLACRLAVIIADDFGADVPAGTAQMAQIYQMNMAHNYGRESSDDLRDRYNLD